MTERLMAAMIRYDSGDAKRIQHFLKVHALARLIGTEEGLDSDEMVILETAALVHDIGIFLTNAPDIFCFGDKPYICHGYLGADLMRAEGYPRHALVCERHTGAGLTLQRIVEQDLPIPHRELVPVSPEEQVICFADKFYSKTKLDKEKSVEKARKSLEKHGQDGLARFDHWCELFL